MKATVFDEIGRWDFESGAEALSRGSREPKRIHPALARRREKADLERWHRNIVKANVMSAATLEIARGFAHIWADYVAGADWNEAPVVAEFEEFIRDRARDDWGDDVVVIFTKKTRTVTFIHRASARRIDVKSRT